jgi:hypothetical protein
VRFKRGPLGEAGQERLLRALRTSEPVALGSGLITFGAARGPRPKSESCFYGNHRNAKIKAKAPIEPTSA